MIYKLVVWLFFLILLFQVFLSILFPFPLPLVFHASSQAHPAEKASSSVCITRPVSYLSWKHIFHSYLRFFFLSLWVHLLLHKISSYLHYIGVRSQTTWGSLFFLIFIKHFASNNIIKTANGLAVFYLNGKFWDF